MGFSEILNILLGGGLVGLVVAVATMKATVRKANADAEKARADAETVRITNTENATRILVENIVKPLKEELNATREKLSETEKLMASIQKELEAAKRALSRLSRAVESANNCPHADDCVVLRKLRNNKKDPDGAEPDFIDLRDNRHDGCCDQDNEHPPGAREQGEPADIRGQPP